MTRTFATMVGGAIGACVGMAQAILVIDRNPDGMYVPQTAIGVIVGHLIEASPLLLIGAGLGFFSAIAMTKGRKTLTGAGIGAVIAAGLSLVILFFSHGDGGLAGQLLLINLPFWALFGAAVGFFSAGKKRDESGSARRPPEFKVQADQWSPADREEFRRLQDKQRGGPQSGAH
jgi:hypothetical protein